MGKIGKLVAGALAGLGIGLLVAPKKGSETRRELRKKMDELLEKARGIDVDEVRDNIEAKIVQIKDELADLDKEKVFFLVN